ncbi:pyridoxamine 5'-phosphate oxidase family protein NDAI_0D00140 [Naumovozyma dairenensis CBS 421]|uniref:Pyridoxamine 5'-phosphate oxidase N-terminal domain-containing protein n=1 Tax=Naumovozyma dairenensis (strain ATCC 10597 / BCRC 20456 / CBS 421 / NBRC 0211 / NRRL Y-12639) TaxID=1071378 RepID=G0W967_NAUDC|nr:hypothetical protein NDAI_0D00140 [Naumovozyma dairenensis CBS 421]CCD24328.1 hypothetical protein NDAI_0D00140 [Naumovozyma dairenensis CBS 421]
MSTEDRFPKQLLDLIKTSKYVHVATSSIDGIPSVSLMNYIYVPREKNYSPNIDDKDYIILATFDDTEKYENIVNNPRISLLFHDWITANNLSLRKTSISNLQASMEPPSDRLNNLLEDLNQDELNQMSATIKGFAEVLDPESNESLFYRRLLLAANPDADISY